MSRRQETRGNLGMSYTLTRWSPMNVVVERDLGESMHATIASRTRSMRASSERACV